MVGRILAEAAGAYGLPGRGAGSDMRALLAATAGLELILVVAAAAAALFTAPVTQMPAAPAASSAQMRALIRGEPCAP